MKRRLKPWTGNCGWRLKPPLIRRPALIWKLPPPGWMYSIDVPRSHDDPDCVALT